MTLLEIIGALLAGLFAGLGFVYTYWRGRSAGRDAQHDRFLRFYEHLAEAEKSDSQFFFEPCDVAKMTSRQKAITLWYFTICTGVWLQKKNRHVEEKSANEFIGTIHTKYKACDGISALLTREGFEADFVRALNLP